MAALKVATESNYVAIEPKLNPWKQKISLLRPEGNFSEAYIKATPYFDFNPKEFIGKILPSLESLKEELFDIFNYANREYHQYLEDPNLLKNKDALNDTQLKFLEEFKNQQLTEYNFPKVMQLITKLERGVTPVSINRDEIQELFNRPINPDELIQNFKDLVNSKLTGIDRNNARISLNS